MIYLFKSINKQKQVGASMTTEIDLNAEPVNLKTFTLRMPRDIWVFLKETSAAQDMSMGDIMVGCVDRYRKKIRSKTASSEVNV